MIVKSLSPLSPDVVIAFNGVEVDYTSVMSITMSLDENKHDVCTVHMAGLHPKAVTDYINAAVRIVISSGAGRKQEFCGYVSYVEPVADERSGLVNRSPFQDAAVVCFGSSIAMWGAKSKVWENTSIGIIATYMAETYNFSLDVDTNSFMYPRLVQKSESDWAFLTRVANMYGMNVTLHGTHLHVYSPSKALGRAASYTKLTNLRSTIDGVPGAITKFEGTFGYVTPNGKSTNYFVASMDKDGTITTVRSEDVGRKSINGNELGYKYRNLLPSTAKSVGEAEMEIKARHAQERAFNATIDLVAGAGIVPGGVVSLDDYNSKFDGMWYVRSVTHQVGGSGYTTQISVSRDYDLSQDYTIPPVERMQQPPDPVFKAGEWQASVRRVKRYV